ncbi:hypothetical protein AWF39_12885 [Escherichia coli]|nr:hypothetical protein AWF39_12885 [Escherichia coli]KUV21594.1 hypothetical protein AWF41_11470 [Escherichia coli]
MVFTHRFHAHTRFAIGIETRHVAQHQPHFAGRFQSLHHLLVKFIAIFKEMVDAAAFAMGRHQ